MEYSAFSTEIEAPQHTLLAACRELGVAVVAYSPLSRGLLGGGVQGPDDFEEGDVRKFYPRYLKENFPKNMEIVTAIKDVAAKKGVTVGQTALAWLLSRGRYLSDSRVSAFSYFLLLVRHVCLSETDGMHEQNNHVFPFYVAHFHRLR